MASDQIDEFVAKYKEDMKKADVNKDGKISFAEYMDKLKDDIDVIKKSAGNWKAEKFLVIAKVWSTKVKTNIL